MATGVQRSVTWVSGCPLPTGNGVLRGEKPRLRKSEAGATGLEPATSGVTGRRSDQLNYTPANGAIISRPCGFVSLSANRHLRSAREHSDFSGRSRI